MTDHSPPGYPIADTLQLDADQLRVFSHQTRIAILDLLTDQAATISQLAGALEIPKGTIGHHVKRLEEAGMIKVVRTERVRAIEAKYYGRTARTFLLGSLRDHDRQIGIHKGFFLTEAMADFDQAGSQPELLEDKPGISTLRHVRIPDDRAHTWAERLEELIGEFVVEPRGGDTRYGLLIALYPTLRPVIAEDPS